MQADARPEQVAELEVSSAYGREKNRRASGSTDYDLYVRPRRDATGAVLSLTAAMTDVTEAKETVETLRRLNGELE